MRLSEQPARLAEEALARRRVRLDGEHTDKQPTVFVEEGREAVGDGARLVGVSWQL